MGKNWYEALTSDLNHLKDLATDLAEDGMELVFGEDEETPEGTPMDRQEVDDQITHLSTRFAPRQWASTARDALQTTSAWIGSNPTSPELGEVTVIHAALVEGHATFSKMRDWHKIMERLWNKEDACYARDDDTADQLRGRLSAVLTLKNALERRWEESIEDRKIIVAFRPRIQQPVGAFEGLFEQMNRNQKMIAESLTEVKGYRSKIKAAIPAAEAAQEAKQQEQEDFAELDDVHKCATDGVLSDLSQELSGLIFTTWFEKNVASFYKNGKQGGTVQIPLTEFDCGNGGWPGFQRDGAIKGTAMVTELNRNFGSNSNPSSEGHVSFEIEFTSYFTCKSDHFKMASIFSFKRDIDFFFNEDGFEEGSGQDISGFSRTGGDDQPVRR